jgi:hypothetical protein
MVEGGVEVSTSLMVFATESNQFQESLQESFQ